MKTQTASLRLQVADPVEEALLVATCLWDGNCYEPCPHHRATHEEVEAALDWLERHPSEVRRWEERRATGLPPLGLLVQGHVGHAQGAFWECEACGFRFDAGHADAGGVHSCPNCEAALLRHVLDSLVDAVRGQDRPVAKAVIARERLRMWDAARGLADNLS